MGWWFVELCELSVRKKEACSEFKGLNHGGFLDSRWKKFCQSQTEKTRRVQAGYLRGESAASVRQVGEYDLYRKGL
jgi:hypothetical protein